MLVRLLGGMDYWRYGVEELAAAARAHGVQLAIVPGDHCADARLDAASTVAVADLRRLWRCFEAGGPDNLSACLAFIAERLGAAGPAPEPCEVAPFGRFEAACREAAPGAPHALIVFYRSILLAADTAPIDGARRRARRARHGGDQRLCRPASRTRRSRRRSPG